MERRPGTRGIMAVVTVLGLFGASYRCDAQASTAPILSWAIHDTTRAQPPVVDPGPSMPSARPPSDAIILFDGRDGSEWRSQNGQPLRWKIESGYLESVGGTGGIATVRGFGDCQLHIEWAAPTPATGAGQARGNSGVFFMGQYEVQVLDSYRNPTYPDGQAAAIYGQFPPLVNASRRPGEWQTYDIVFTAPRFKENQLETPASITVIHNGIVVHNHTALLGTTGHRVLGAYTAHPPKAPLMLQDHSHPVRYRNIWIRELKGYDAAGS